MTPSTSFSLLCLSGWFSFKLYRAFIQRRRLKKIAAYYHKLDPSATISESQIQTTRLAIALPNRSDYHADQYFATLSGSEQDIFLSEAETLRMAKIAARLCWYTAIICILLSLLPLFQISN